MTTPESRLVVAEFALATGALLVPATAIATVENDEAPLRTDARPVAEARVSAVFPSMARWLASASIRTILFSRVEAQSGLALGASSRALVRSLPLPLFTTFAVTWKSFPS